ncbi:MAG: Cna domain protein [Candidatus Solibacter sp.]|nr:Cna domain protein [Candidatus Solibacter sp.]
MSLRTRFALSFCLLTWSVAQAQVITGTILGTVTDRSGSAVKAKITIVNTGTGVQSETATNESGDFERPSLQPGLYKVTIAADGFKTFHESNVNLVVDSKYRLNAVLELGSVAESVTVVANAQVLQTDQSDLSTTLSKDLMESIPNVGRNPMMFVLAAAGVTPTGAFEDPGNSSANGDDGRMNLTRFSVNGSRPVSSEIQLDGAPNTSTSFNEAAVLPNPDAIGQFKIITNAYSAEFGRAGGGVVQFQTKSGENKWHGSLYEFARNSALNANTFGNNMFGRDANGRPLRAKGVFNTHQFGGTFSGPVLLPHLFDGHNKTFFFVSYEGSRRAQDASGYFTVPTALERTGDFSQSYTAVTIGGVIQQIPRNIYLPLPSTSTVTTVSAGQFRVDNPQASSGGVLNKIPSQYLNPTALKLLAYYPLPNIAPINPDGTSNYFASVGSKYRTDQLIVKMDHNFSAKHKTFFRWTTDWSLYDPRNWLGKDNPGNDAAPMTQFNPTATLGHTWSISTRSLVELRANVTRINLLSLPPTTDLAALGFSAPIVASAATNSFPRISPGTYSAIGTGNFVYRNNHSTNFSFTGNFTHIFSKWTTKIGAEYRPLFSNLFQPQAASFSFGASTYSRSCTGTGCPTLPTNRSEGFSPADFLMGGGTGGFNGTTGQYDDGAPAMAVKNGYWAVYSQNDWKATRSLTVNIGVRWDYQGPLTDRYDRLSQFDINGTNATGTRGVYLFAGRNGVPRGQTNDYKKGFAPRVGFAWRVNNKTVVRSAYGISFDMITGVGTGAQGFGADGYSAPAYINTLPPSGVGIINAPFNTAFNGGGLITSLNPQDPAYLGRSVTAIMRGENRVPYLQQWNFTIEREIRPGFSGSIGYVGTKGTFITIQQHGIDRTTDIPWSVLDNARQVYTQTGANPLSQTVTNPFAGIITGNAALSSPTISVQNLSLPYPAWGGITIFQQRLGSSSYNSLQGTVRKSFGHGVELIGSYTWSKNIDYGASISGAGTAGNVYYAPDNIKLDRSISGFNQPNRAVITWLGELPFGRGKPLLAHTPVLSQLLGGWKVSGVTTFATGLPIAVTGGTGSFGRPNIVGNPVLDPKYRCQGDGVTACALPDGTSIVVPKNRLLWFNPHAYAGQILVVPSSVGATTTKIITDPYWFGTGPRFYDGLRRIWTNNFNLTLARTFRVKEGVKAEFRADALNAFNRVEWAAPDGGFGTTNTNAGPGLLQSTSTTFGTIDMTATPARTPRYLQVSLRFSF